MGWSLWGRVLVGIFMVVPTACVQTSCSLTPGNILPEFLPASSSPLQLNANSPTEIIISTKNVGDINHDGSDDVAFGVMVTDPGLSVREVYVRVKLMINSLPMQDAFLNIFEVSPEAGQGGFIWLGYSLCPIGDVDGDNTPDFAAGAPYYESNHGAAFLYYMTVEGGGLALKGRNVVSKGASGGQNGFAAGTGFGFDLVVFAGVLVSPCDSTNGKVINFVALESCGAPALAAECDVRSEAYIVMTAGFLIMVGDLSGDGKSDLVVLGHDAALDPICVAYSSQSTSEIGRDGVGSYIDFFAATGIADVNGDGLPDFAFIGASGAGLNLDLVFATFMVGSGYLEHGMYEDSTLGLFVFGLTVANGILVYALWNMDTNESWYASISFQDCMVSEVEATPPLLVEFPTPEDPNEACVGVHADDLGKEPVYSAMQRVCGGRGWMCLDRKQCCCCAGTHGCRVY